MDLQKLRVDRLILLLVLLIGCGKSEVTSHGPSPVTDWLPSTEPTRHETESSDQTAAQADTPLNDESGVLSGKVIKIIDGDTLDILTDDKQTIRIRLEGIDTPERGQPFGTKAKEKLAELTFGKVVSVRSIGKDRYGRELGRITVDGIDVNLELVRAGMAWHYKQYSKEQALADAEQEARAAKRGLWIDEKPIAPWDWRKVPKEERK